jgi:hypothetical protein
MMNTAHCLENISFSRGLCSMELVLLYPPKKRLWSDVSQMSDQGVDPTSLLTKGEREVMVMQFDFHRLLLIIFTNSNYTQGD